MKNLFLLPLILALIGCVPVESKKQVIVDGEATIELTPDIFVLSAKVRARHENRASALAKMSETLASIHETLPDLSGLTNLTIDSSEALITTIQDAACLDERDYSSREACPVVGYFASVDISARGSPADRSGPALALLSQLGAEAVTLETYTSSTIEAARQEALEKAVENARAKANKIAASSGSTLLGPIRIQYGEGFNDMDRYYRQQSAASPDGIVVAGNRQAVEPDIDLNLDPQKIRINEKVTAAFEIE